MSKKSKKSRKQKSSRREPVSEPGDFLLSLFQLVVGMLLVARLLIPTESAAQGDTLWLVQLWLAAGLLWVLSCHRQRDFRIRFDRFDVLLAVVVLGHVVSAVVVVLTEGQKRAAINMLWEWVGLGLSFFLMRQALRSLIDGRRLLLAMVVATASLAGLGLWQHYVFYPQTSIQYGELRRAVDELKTAPKPASLREQVSRNQQIRQRQRDLIEFGVPTDALTGQQRRLWENRLRISSEPFGFFALANTFAGILSAWLVVAVGVLWASWRTITKNGWQKFASLLTVALIAYCLLLTKSRTAYVGCIFGILALAWQGLPRHSGKSIRKLITWLVLGTAVLSAGIGLAGLTGGFDRQTISEAPKSWRYRMEYWTGASRVLKQNPLFGTGPGNFRPHYLKHKLPESSEEIADPHNLLLDLWTSGGLLAVVGAIALLVTAVRTFGGRQRETPAEDSATTSSTKKHFLFDPMLVGCGLGFVMVFVGGLLFRADGDMRVPTLLVTSILFAVLLCPLFRSIPRNRGIMCVVAAATALMIHLLGAGGMEMPAVGQSLLILLALASVFGSDHASSSKSSRALVWTMGLMMLCGFVLCLYTATLPVTSRRAMLSAGDFEFSRSGNVRRAESQYRAASEADPLSPEPFLRLAALQHRKWQQSAGTDDRIFQDAVETQQLAVQRNPYSANGYRTLGNWQLEKFRLTGNIDDALAAGESLRKAVDRYPSHALLRAQLSDAFTLAKLNEQAREQAQEALRLDQLNRRAGHRDKFLTKATIELMQNTVEGEVP